jgi:RNA polymerase sigma factor (sigma-70 family)
VRLIETTDTAIIEEVLNGNESAFAELVSRYQNYVFTLTLRIVKSREDAEEVAQDCFIKAFRALPDFKGTSKFSTWLYAIAYTTSLSFLRKKKINTFSIDNENVFEIISNQNAEQASNLMEQKSRSSMINKAIDFLNPEDALVISLFYRGEQSLEEIGKVMNLEPNTVKVRLFRARKKLKEVMESNFAQEVKDLY